MTTGGRTTWWAKDAAWHRRELLVELGEEFGAAGPHVIDVLSCWAQEQRAAGVVRGGFRGLAREAFVTVDHAQSIVRHAASIGALDDLAIDADGRRFTCRVSGFRADQERGRAAWRQAAKRDRDADDSEQDVTDRDESRPITQEPPPDQTRPEEEPPYPPADAGGTLPKRPTSRRARELTRYDDEVQSYAAARFPDLDEPERSQMVRAALGQGGTVTHDTVAAYVRHWCDGPREVSAA